MIDYNLDGKPQGLYVNDACRARDHDPVIVTLDLAPTYVTASFTVVRSSPTGRRRPSTARFMMEFAGRLLEPGAPSAAPPR